MSEEKRLFKKMLDVIIDGVALSEVDEERAIAGRKLLDGAVSQYPHLIDSGTLKQIQVIIEMADEAESPKFSL